MSDYNPADILESLIGKSIKAGAHAADAVLFDSRSVSVSYRLGKLEDVERSENFDLGLRVMVGKRQAAVSSNDRRGETLDELVARCVAMARAAPEDPYCGLADDDYLARKFPALDLLDPHEPDTEKLKESAAAAEAAALSVRGVVNSEGADASWGTGGFHLATSAGFYGGYEASSRSISCSVVAADDNGMERDYDYFSALHAEDMIAPETIGRTAGERAVRRLSPRKARSAKAPVIYENRLAGGILSHLTGAIRGSAVARGVSFLKDKLGQQIFPEAITIIDDPHRRRGLASKPFDGEGVKNRRTEIIKNGVLTTWLLNSAQARQLKMELTGHATRGAGGPPGSGSTNLHMEPGAVSRAQLIGDVDEGLFVTDMFGPSVNGNTGDYSVGVSGFWIEKGEIAYPVSEITVAGNLLDMFMNMTPANDLEFRGSKNAPSLRIDGMTIAGS